MRSTTTPSAVACRLRRGGRGTGRGGGASCGIAPDNKHFVDVYQTHDTPAATRLVDDSGAVVAQLAESDVTRFNELGLKKAEMFTYKSADGGTTLHGVIQFPSHFDPTRKYPVLVPVYGGPCVGQCDREGDVRRAARGGRVRLPDRQSGLA